MRSTKGLALLGLGLAACGAARAGAAGVTPAPLGGGEDRTVAGAPHDHHPGARQAPAGSVLETQVPFQRWAALPGRKVGLLVAVDGAWGTLIGWGKALPSAPASLQAYWFLADGDSPRALYFESHGEGQNFIAHWRVPLADGSETYYDAAMFGPGVPNRFGLGAGAHLVELEINGGRGSPASYVHFVATDVHVLDGTDDHPLHAAAVLAQAAGEFHRFVDGQRGAIDSAMHEVAERAGPPLGPEKSSSQEGVFPTWSADDQRLRVLFVRQEKRASTHTELRTVGYPCRKYQDRLPSGGGVGGGPNAPLQLPGRTLARCPPPHEQPVSMTKGYGVELAAAYEFDASGRLIAVTEYTPAALPYHAPQLP